MNLLTLTGTKQLEGDVRSFIFKADSPTNWTAGQYLHLILKHDNEDDRGNERWFTISSAPSETELRISTRIVADKPSSFKQALSNLEIGDTIQADGPEGDFTLGDLNRNYIFVAGGIGVTPFHSIITEAATLGTMPHITLLYANRTDNIAFKSELDGISQANPNLQIQYIMSPARIDTALLQETITATDNPIIYVSGPEPMVEAFTEELAGLGVTKENIKADYFPGYEAF